MTIRHLAAGPLSMMFDTELAFLRHLKFGDQEVVRGIYAAVRDRNWDTIPISVHDLTIEQTGEQFSVSFLAQHSLNDIHFQWHGQIAGSETGDISFRFDGKSLNSFLKNRIGLCVLHPQECAGRACRVEHTDGSHTDSRFPELISPQQPFKNIRSITHSVVPNVEATVTFFGEAFEMEDQRNWTDASFKTYSTPLDLPFPVEVKPGSRIKHEVAIELTGIDSSRRSPAKSTNEIVRVQIDWQASHQLPFVGFSTPPSIATPQAIVVKELQAVSPDHLRVDVRLCSDNWREQAQTAIELAERVNSHLEVAVFLDDTMQPDWRRCLDLFVERKAKIARWLIFHSTAKATTPELAATAFQSLRTFQPSVPMVVGTDAYFAELNRNRPPIVGNGCVCFSMNPQVHAFDSLSIRETLRAQRATIDTANALFHCPVVVSPITLRPRSNPNATAISKLGACPEPEIDDRQATGFLAAWTVGVLSQLATHPAVASLTFYEAFGPRGILDESGKVCPVHSVFAALRRHRSTCDTVVDRPLDVSAIALTCENGSRGLLLGNMTDTRQTVSVQLEPNCATCVTLEAESVMLLGDGELR